MGKCNLSVCKHEEEQQAAGGVAEYAIALSASTTGSSNSYCIAALLASVVEARGMASYCFLMLSPAFFFQSVTHTASHGDTPRNIT